MIRRSILGIVLAVFVLAAVGSARYTWNVLNQPLTLSAERTLFEVPAGTPFSIVTRDLAERGFIRAPRLFEWFARARGDARRIRAGEYELTQGLTPLTLLELFISGDVYLHSITVIEGWRYDEFVTAVRAHPAVLAGAATPPEIMRSLGKPDLHPEGQFLPDTYLFPAGTTDLELFQWAHEALAAELEQAWASRNPEAELETAYAALILASIIEKETALAEERKLISGVFHERLARGMRLQTDPTVIYGLGSAYDGNLTRRNLDTDNPYNTYTRAGLPPTPISLPGAAAINAAVQPEKDGSLYFVATGEADGSHRFSRTLEEHNQAVRDYLRRQRQRANE